MKAGLLALTLAMLLFPASLEAGCCTPNATVCTACRDCSNCKYCAIDRKGSCSVCRNQTPDQTRKRDAKRP